MRKLALISFCVLMLAGQAHAAAQPTLADIRQMMIGTWQSTDDTRFTRELDADGKAVDRYDGDASATTPGEWTVFSGATAPADLVNYKFHADGVYLEVQQNGDTLLFALTGADRASLQMVYLERGNTLSFTRLK